MYYKCSLQYFLVNADSSRLDHVTSFIHADSVAFEPYYLQRFCIALYTEPKMNN